ncbi:MAG: gamma-glutamyltransferase family protein [Anaerolineae bacterium]|jgi:gamma-glutamyltranspeptidase/glutathione hydrolase|nr:gamma-glutamyltransferase family protein [Anaerolineae bacterium]
MSDLPFLSRRSPVYGRRGMVAASQPLAVAAGLEILAAGGTAADAAVATAAALNVTEPGSTGIGGDCFALYYEAATGQVTALNGSGRAPAALTLERLKREGFGVGGSGLVTLPPYHPYTVTVPGACAGWCDMVERFGRMPLPMILAPAIRLAEEGFPVAPIAAYHWSRAAEQPLRQSLGGLELTIAGRGPRRGEIFRNPGLAGTLQTVAAGGKDAFYQGEIAAAIAETVQRAGGCLTIDDLAAHRSTWERPISVTYRGVRVWECPPNGQGLTALLALNLLEGFDLAGLDPLAPERLHLKIEAMRLAFADARWHIADPQFTNVPIHQLLSKAYAADRRKLINPKRATLDQRRGTPVASSDTVYFCVVDGEGNASSFINSNYMSFGTGIVPSGWGFALQNRGHNFSLDPEHPNAVAPRKRPYHTIIPGMLTRMDGTLLGPFGVMGGFMQPQGHMQVVVALADDKLDPQVALDRPRFCIVGGTAGGDVGIEEGIPPQTLRTLKEMGHPAHAVSGHDRSLFGRGQIILCDSATGVLCAGSDPRADGCAMAL